MPPRAGKNETSSVNGGQLEENGLPKLQFKEPLSWRAGKPIAVAELLRRLQDLSNEMRELDQQEMDRNSFTRVAKDLVNPSLLAHKDKGVRAWVACCLVDILRLCAPDAPFTGQHLKDIFSLIISSILPALADPSHAYNQQHFYVLSSLSQIKSIVLLSDIPDSEKLISTLFITFFDILEGTTKSSTEEQITKNVEFHMTEILVILVDESASLPAEVIDVIVAQFLRVDPQILGNSTSTSKGRKATHESQDQRQSKLPVKDLPRSYNLAKTICNSCRDKMARYISQYFNDIILDASSAVADKAVGKGRRVNDDLDSPELDMSLAPTEEDLRELAKAHLLLRELWRACPGVLHNVIPQLEAELSAENVHLRLLATQTLGDMIAGVGAAGYPQIAALDAARYPYATLADSGEAFDNQNIAMKPSSPQPFPQSYPQAYNCFLSRRHDKSPLIRAAWATGVCRILRTSAGGVGLSNQEEDQLVRDMPRMLTDGDEKVRYAAVKAIGSFSLKDVVLQLGSLGGIEKSESVLAVLAERVRDRKHSVRTEAMLVLGRLWGAAVGELLQGDDRVQSVLGPVPARILDTFMTNDPDLHFLIDRVLFEHLLPWTFPLSRTSKAGDGPNGETSKTNTDQRNGATKADDFDPNQVRIERILLLVKHLEEKSKKVFYALQSRQHMLSRVMDAYLRTCEDFNGGVMESNEKEVRTRLLKLIDTLAKGFPDSLRMSDYLSKFAKMHDRRAYQLIRYCMAPESDYRTVLRARRELIKRLEESNSASSEFKTAFVALLYRVSSVIYNRSHIAPIMEYSRLENHGLASTAQEILRDISTRTPEILKAQIADICKHIQDEAPTAKKTNDPRAIDNLKACASFAGRFAGDIPKDRKFVAALTSFATRGSPEAAKHAVSILMAVSDKKELHAKELVQSCIKGYEWGAPGFLAKLATLSQLMLLAPDQANLYGDQISEIAIENVLLQNRTPVDADMASYMWSDTTDDEVLAKIYALKIVVNRARSHSDPETLGEILTPVYSTLSKLVSGSGELLPSNDTHPAHKSRLRMVAAQLSLKLCLNKQTEALFSPPMFNALALVTQDPLTPVRTRFLQRLKKYLGLSKLPQRFYTIPFLLAYEPEQPVGHDTITWLRGRATFFHNFRSDSQNSRAAITMESIFARLLSLLAHHPDYGSRLNDLKDFSRYILFYLQAIANEENLSLIYHIAQRVKQMRDTVAPSKKMDERLHQLSDLAQLTIRKFEEIQNWTMQTQPGKASLPKTLFAEIKDHSVAQQIAEKNFLPQDLEDVVEDLVKASMKAARAGQHSNRKRKSEHEEASRKDSRDSKKVKTLPLRKASGNKEKTAKMTGTNGRTMKANKKTPSSKKPTDASLTTSAERRRSGRVKNDQNSYLERNDDEDDEEMMDGVAEWSYEGANGQPSDDKDEDEDEERVNLVGSDAQEVEEADGSDDDKVSQVATATPVSKSSKSPAPKRGKGKRAAPATPTRPARKAGRR